MTKSNPRMAILIRPDCDACVHCSAVWCAVPACAACNQLKVHVQVILQCTEREQARLSCGHGLHAALGNLPSVSADRTFTNATLPRSGSVPGAACKRRNKRLLRPKRFFRYSNPTPAIGSQSSMLLRLMDSGHERFPRATCAKCRLFSFEARTTR